MNVNETNTCRTDPVRSVLIVDDHAFVSDLIAEAIAADRRLVVVGKTSEGLRAIELARQFHPDILVLDVILPDISGVEVLRRIRSEFPDMKVLVFSARHDPQITRALMKSGISGFVSKQSSLSELRRALRAIALGNSWFSEDFTQAIRQAISAPNHPGAEALTQLTTREREVAVLIARSYSSKQVAGHLGISVKTAENHRASLKRKLGVSDVAALVRFVIRIGLIDPTLE